MLKMSIPQGLFDVVRWFIAFYGFLHRRNAGICRIKHLPSWNINTFNSGSDTNLQLWTWHKCQLQQWSGRVHNQWLTSLRGPSGLVMPPTMGISTRLSPFKQAREFSVSGWHISSHATLKITCQGHCYWCITTLGRVFIGDSSTRVTPGWGHS